ncbi:GNAT family N-acetyltransferase [Glaciecola sp. MH2013]|uniref:GNAT family N-acetyltransferase n=1 Tax=Glaciecola sp. MH2013 TaxID=2785524 RepID=UPI0018A08A86|nr:GNAT family N-acetyltransferase [Glaciecola sp. MH2013]MBF7073990.1 GNAT family N-acetyltransferase [Glaciecola sp. MH2013]
MELVKPCLRYKQSYISYIQELGEEERYPFPLDFDHSDFVAMLQRNEDFAKGVNIPQGYVPSSTWWLVHNEEIIGVVNLRHYLNDNIKHIGGHVGLGIRPSYRGRGLSTKLLGLCMNEAKLLGISALHVHCYESNIASMSMIKSCGGELHSIVGTDDNNAEGVARFIISLCPAH